MHPNFTGNIIYFTIISLILYSCQKFKMYCCAIFAFFSLFEISTLASRTGKNIHDSIEVISHLLEENKLSLSKRKSDNNIHMLLNIICTNMIFHIFIENIVIAYVHNVCVIYYEHIYIPCLGTTFAVKYMKCYNKYNDYFYESIVTI